MAKKVCLITHGTFGVNGTIGTRTYYVAEELSKQGFDVVVLARDSNAPKTSYDVHTLPFLVTLFVKFLTYVNRHIDTQEINNVKQSVMSFFFKRKLKRLRSLDYVHSWEFFPSVYKLVKAKFDATIIQDVPIALMSILPTFLEGEEIWVRKEDTVLKSYVRRSFENIDFFLAPSDFVVDSLLNEKIPKKKILVAPFGVDIKKFKPAKNRPKKFTVAFVGNITFRKGLTYLIQAWKELDLKDAKLNLYGSVYPDMKSSLTDAKKYNIFAPGYTPVAKIMSSNSIYIIPSLMEGSSKTVYEAMACELPVIATRNAGPIFTDGKEGKIIPPKNVEAIKKSILFFYNNRQEIEKYGKRGRKTVKKYTWEDYAKRVSRFYKK